MAFGMSPAFVGFIVVPFVEAGAEMVYLIFAMTLYPLPPRVHCSRQPAERSRQSNS